MPMSVLAGAGPRCPVLAASRRSRTLSQYIGPLWGCLERWRAAAGAVLLLLAGGAGAATYPMPPPGEDLVGELGVAVVAPGETLLDIARRHGLGLEELKAANPGVDPWLPEPGRRILLPTRYVLPPGPREGIVVNLPELRLYYFPPPGPDGRRVVETYPLGIGAEGRSIPLGRTRIVAKRRDPPWVVPASIREEHAREGNPLPPVVPPGPDNPLGRFALRLGFPGYLIHGTHRPFSVGMRVSHGCLRLYPEDIERLYARVPVGTPVRIENRPVKVGWSGGMLHVEAHPPLEEDRRRGRSLTPLVRAVLRLVQDAIPEVFWEEALEVVRAARGIPQALPSSHGLRPVSRS